MKQGRTERDWVVVAVMTFCAGVLVTWALTSAHPTKLTLTSEQWAAWVQAIGSITAILIAVAVPATQHYVSEREKRSEKADRARSLGLLLLPHITKFGENINAVWSFEHPDDDVEALGDSVCAAGPITLGSLEVPEHIVARIHELHELGAAAAGLQRAIFNVTSALELVGYANVFRRDAIGKEIEVTVKAIHEKDRFYDLLWDALMGLNESQTRIEGIFRFEASQYRRMRK